MTSIKRLIFRRDTIIFLIFALVLTVVSWAGEVDEYSDAYLDEALISAGAIYATARGINAVVSLLQGTEINAVVLTVTVGEILDPLNDLIERFSAIMLVALGSLALQSILLHLVSDSLFSVLLSANLVFLFVAAYSGRGGFARARKIFLISVFARYSLVIAVIASGAADHYFLAEDDSERHAAMQSLQADLSELSTAVTSAGATLESVEEAKQEHISLQAEVERAETVLIGLLQALEREERELARLLSTLPWWQRVNPLSEDPPELAEKKKSVSDLHTRRKAAEEVLETAQSVVREHSKALDCLQRKLAGRTCGFLDRIQSGFSPAQFKSRLRAIESGTAEFVKNTIAILMSLLVKTVLLPLAFLLATLQVYRWSTRQFPASQ